MFMVHRILLITMPCFLFTRHGILRAEVEMHEADSLQLDHLAMDKTLDAERVKHRSV